MSERISANEIPVLAVKHHHKPTPAQRGGTIYTRSFTGIYRNLRMMIAGALAALFFATAWINWNGRQAVLWDLGERKFYVFGTTFWPQDFTLLALVMIIAAFILLGVTVVAGRVWCGYACPQSTWVWAFMWVEKITEGDSYQRVKLDAAPWSRDKILRKFSKHSLWIFASLATGLTFMGYFLPIRELATGLFTAQIELDYAFWVFFIALCTYLNAGWLREKVCTHMCPYARFQSVMFDKDTRIIAYDVARGENRGSRKKEEDYKAQGLGDCIDCHMCVQVCPTGIDIRDGLQMDCIGCAACVDACDSVMEKMGYAKGLVSYTSEHELAGEKRNTWRTSSIAYVVATIIMIAALAFTLLDREQMSMGVYRDRSLFHTNSAGEIVNVYRLKVTNKTQEFHRYQIALDNDNAQDDAGALNDSGGLYLVKNYEFELAPGERLDVPVTIAFRKSAASINNGIINFNFVMTDTDNSEQSIKHSGTFLVPKK